MAARGRFTREAGSFIWFILDHCRRCRMQPCGGGVRGHDGGPGTPQSSRTSVAGALGSELVVRGTAQRAVSVESLRSQARRVLEFAQLIVEVALEASAVLALEVRELVDRTLERRLLRFEGRQRLVALGFGLADDVGCFLLSGLDELVALALTFGDMLVVDALSQSDETMSVSDRKSVV